jgi:SOS-response transcriptional repressor LexA
MPDASKLIEIANFFKIENIGALLGYSLSGNTLKESDQLNRTVPIVDYVEFGANPTAKARIIDEMELPTVNLKTGDFFGILIEDNSMNRSDIKRGDIAIIRRQGFASTGDIALVVRPGEPPLLRRVFVMGNDIISLQPDSTDVSYLPILLKNEGEEYEILGRLTYKISSY